MALLLKYMFIVVLYIAINNYSVFAKLHNINYGTWCDPQLCHNSGAKHIACNNPGTFGPKCSRDAVLLDVSPYKDHFLYHHNRLRNKIAMGRLPGYKPAAKMATMMWSDELAYLASLNAKTCDFEHDKCFNTYKFLNTGQCLSGLWSAKDQPLNLTLKIVEAVHSWFDEYKLIDMSYIEKFRIEPNFEDYGHFTEFVVDRNTHVGCAIVQFSQPDQKYYNRINVVCDYASVHHYDGPLYESGKPASKCQTGRNPNYPGLCTENEYFNPNIYNYDLDAWV